MERMWRKVNHSFTGRATTKSGTMHSTDTVSSAGGFGDGQFVVAVAGMPSSTATGRRLAASGQMTVPTGIVGVAGGTIVQKSLSQHVLANSTVSSTERRRRRRRKSRPRRTGVTVSCVGGGGGDNMSSSGGFYTIKESTASNHRHHRQSYAASSSSSRMMASSAPSGTVMMYPNPNPNRELLSVTSGATSSQTASQTVPNTASNTTADMNETGNGATAIATVPDISLRQRAVAKLRMFNFHLNWDLHMTHCKPCGPRISSGNSSSGGNIIMRRLCRNRRREDNELYRSNSFKFERFERKECLDELSDTLQKKIAICDDYSLPVDFVKKRPSSFDPCLAEAIPTNLETWIASSPQAEFIAFAEACQQRDTNQKDTNSKQQQGDKLEIPTPPPPPAPLSTLATAKAAINALAAAASNNSNNNNNNNSSNNNAVSNNVLPNGHQSSLQPTNSQKSLANQRNSYKNNKTRLLTLPTNAQKQQLQREQQEEHLSLQQRGHLHHQHLAFPHAIKHASVKLIEGYSDPKDSKRHKKVYHKKSKRRTVAHHKNQHNESKTTATTNTTTTSATNQKQQQKPEKPQEEETEVKKTTKSQEKDKRSNYSSDSSAPKSSDDEDDDNVSVKVPELNSPDSISDDLVRPLAPILNRSPRKLTAGPGETSKRNPSPYYYSDLLKAKDAKTQSASEKEAKRHSRHSTASEPAQQTQQPINLTNYRKSTSLDVPSEREEREDTSVAGAAEEDEEEDDFELTEPTSRTIIPAVEPPKRYSFTEEGVHIIRCDSPSTSTDSEESDCSECQKRREWHARELALVRKTCNVQPLIPSAADCHYSVSAKCLKRQAESAESKETPSMPPHRLLGPAVCACVAPSTLGDDLDEYFRPRSIFYVHPHGVHECADCAPADSKNNNKKNLGSSRTSRSLLDASSVAHSNNTLENDDDEDDEMSGRTRQIYETAFDCKIAKSDDDLDEVDRVTNHSVLLELNNGTNLPVSKSENRKSAQSSRSRLEGKRLKNSKNQAIQEQACTNASGGNGFPLSADIQNHACEDGKMTALSNELGSINLRDSTQVDQQNNTNTNSTSTSQLPLRGYTPSPPSTAPLPMKFPGKQNDRYFMNSIKSAPNLPSSNPAHPRLRDLRLPIQSSLRQQQSSLSQQSSLLGTSNENSLTDTQDHGEQHHHRHQAALSLSNSSRSRERPRSFVLESGRVMELRKSHTGGNSHHHHVGNGTNGQRTRQNTHDYSSTESIATSSSGGSMESLRSSTSEGNRSTSSSESRHSTSLSSHSSESGSSSVAFPLRAPVLLHSKLHILSPISDKSSLEPSASEAAEQNNKTVNSSPEDKQNHQQSGNQKPVHGHTVITTAEISRPPPQLHIEALKKKRPAANKTLMHLADEIIGSDSGISLHSREDGKTLSGLQKFTLPKLNLPAGDKAADSSTSAIVSNSIPSGLPQDLRDLPFDMPKLRRRKTLQQDTCTSGSATSVDLGDLPFDMPKLRRRLRANQTEINNLIVHSTESSGISQASSSHSMTRDDNKTSAKLDSSTFRQNLTLNLNETRQPNKFGSLDLRGVSSNKDLNLNISQGFSTAVDLIDVTIPLDRQGWYHGAITRIDAESTLRPLSEGTFLVRNCESTKQDYSLSLKGAKGFMHMRIQRNEAGQYILGQFSRPFDTVPEMIRHFCLNRLPVRGAEHMCLIEPVIAQLL